MSIHSLCMRVPERNMHTLSWMPCILSIWSSLVLHLILSFEYLFFWICQFFFWISKARLILMMVTLLIYCRLSVAFAFWAIIVLAEIAPSWYLWDKTNFVAPSNYKGLTPQLNAAVQTEHGFTDVVLKEQCALQLSHVFSLPQCLLFGLLWSHRIAKGILYF